MITDERKDWSASEDLLRDISAGLGMPRNLLFAPRRVAGGGGIWRRDGLYHLDDGLKWDLHRGEWRAVA